MSLRHFFRGVTLEVEDLFLLEAFQIAYLPGWAPERDFAAVLWAYPAIQRFLAHKHPPVASYLEGILAQHEPVGSDEELAGCADNVVWTIADLLVYNKCPEFYDGMGFHQWDLREITNITPLDGKIVIDGGAGTGRVALEAARTARYVFAVEPVTRLRQFMREKATRQGQDNVYVIDGFLHAIPLPDDFADVLITSHALGWQLEDELREFERVVKTDGWVIHCPGTADGPHEDETHNFLISADWAYAFARYKQPDGWKRKYWRQLRA